MGLLQVGTVFQPLVTYESPPTYFETDKINSSFQEIVHAYGIARYREVNPTVFTIITFPFLFAVMFGDVGHGLLMLFFAVYLVTSEKSLGKQQLNEIFEMAFGGGCNLPQLAIDLFQKLNFFPVYTAVSRHLAKHICMHSDWSA